MILVTGSSGFVGPHLIRELTANGYQVTGCAHNGNADYRLDITNKEKVAGLIADLKPDMIVHLAGFSSVKESFAHSEICKKVNVEGTRNLLDAVKKYIPETRILIISSSEVYGNPDKLPVAETAVLHPLNPYAQSRVEQEALVKNYQLNWIISRSFNHIGPGQSEGFVTSDFARQIARIIMHKETNAEISVGNLSAQRDFLDVRDVVKAYRLLLERGKKENIYNVCSGKSLSIKDLLTEFLQLSPVKIKVNIDHSKYRPIEIKEIRGDNSKITKDLGWHPQIALAQSLQDILEYWQERV